MANPPAHNRIGICGTLDQAADGGSEIFEFGFADKSVMSVDQIATLVSTQAVSFWDGGGLQISSHAQLTHVVAERIDATGKVVGSYRVDNTPRPGDNTNGVPTLCCNAVTLETAGISPKGGKIRGRMFPPASLSQIVGSTSTVSDASLYAVSWKGFLATLNSDGLSICVASSTGAGSLPSVTGVSVDTILDTQRRRKNHVTGHRSPIETF